jgi:hypothetical protein
MKLPNWFTAKDVALKIKLPFLDLNTTWTPNRAEKQAAFETLVEYITRTAVIGLKDEDGIIREAMNSLYALFGINRELLKRFGADVAPDKGDGTPSFAVINVRVLNEVLRPFLSTWHPLLDAHEESRPDGVAKVDWERQWSRHDECRAALKDMRVKVRQYIEALGEAAGTQEFAATIKADAEAGPR